MKDEAYKKLLDMIFDGQFVHGQVYSLSAVAEKLQMSKTPIRDAIQRLSNEGRMDVLPSRGFCLHPLSDDELQQRFHFSNAIEGYCVYYLAKKRRDGETPVCATRLCKLVQKMQALDLDTVTFGEFSRLDNAFHHEIVGAVKSADFAAVANNRYGLIDSPELHLTRTSLSYADILHYHETIATAIWEGRTMDAYAAMLAHADAVYQSYLAAKNARG